QEDVADAVALGGEVVVVMLRTPVAGGQCPEHDGRGRDVVGQRLELEALFDAVVQQVHLRYPNPVHDSTPTSSPLWLRYSTSISQKRPVPSLVVFSSLTERNTWRVDSTSPGRTGPQNVR